MQIRLLKRLLGQAVSATVVETKNQHPVEELSGKAGLLLDKEVGTRGVGRSVRGEVLFAWGRERSCQQRI